MAKNLAGIGQFAGGGAQQWERIQARKDEENFRRSQQEELKRQFEVNRQDRKEMSGEAMLHEAEMKFLDYNLKAAEQDRLSDDELNKMAVMDVMQRRSSDRHLFLSNALTLANLPPERQAQMRQSMLDSFDALDNWEGPPIADAFQRNPQATTAAFREMQLRNDDLKKQLELDPAQADSIRQKLHESVRMTSQQLAEATAANREARSVRMASMLKNSEPVPAPKKLMKSLLDKGVNEDIAKSAISRSSKTGEDPYKAVSAILAEENRKAAQALKAPTEPAGIPQEPDVSPEVKAEEDMRAMSREREKGRARPLLKEPASVGLIADFKGAKIQLPPPEKVLTPHQASTFSLKSTPSKESLLKKLAVPGAYEKAYKAAVKAGAIRGDPDPEDPKVVTKVVNWVMRNNTDDSWF